MLCGRGAKYEHDGKWYCKTHHPPTVDAKNAARNAAWQCKWDEQERILKAAESARNERERRAALFDDLLDSLREAYGYIDCIPETAAGGDDAAIGLAKRLRAAIAKAEGK
jgi:hypothetical protein